MLDPDAVVNGHAVHDAEQTNATPRQQISAKETVEQH